MRKLAEQAADMLHLVGAALYSRPDLDQAEARRYHKRLLRLICLSGEADCDPAVFSSTEDGKQLSHAARLYIRLSCQRPDPDQLDGLSCMVEFKNWYEKILLAAAGAQQEYELSKDS